ncbi:MAG: hypothetical protein U7126_21395 [Microcoleus sp.]
MFERKLLKRSQPIYDNIYLMGDAGIDRQSQQIGAIGLSLCPLLSAV